MKEHSQLVGACGYDCNACDIFRATDNPSIAHRTVERLKKEHAIEVCPQDIRCLGCSGHRSKHWNPECWILECCVDRKGLGFCYQCRTFPCDKLNEWAKGSRRYQEALDRLDEMKKNEENAP